MRIVAVIPARYASTRFPGKPLADICGKPMLWWVYKSVSNIPSLSEVVCAIDDERIQKVCIELGMNYVLTKNNHPNHISRVQEAAEKMEADYYICINGDEPLITEQCILPVLPDVKHITPYFCGAMRKLTSPAETIDCSNIKLIISDVTKKCLYMSRTPIPYPKGTLDLTYNKYVGVECFNKQALDFFVSAEMGTLEKAEDIDHLRFLENGVDLYFKYVDSESISVDTPKDLDFVRKSMEQKSVSKSFEKE